MYKTENFTKVEAEDGNTYLIQTSHIVSIELSDAEEKRLIIKMTDGNEILTRDPHLFAQFK